MTDTSPPHPFVHLRLHTEFSISDGLVTIDPLVEQLRELPMPAVAVTDLSNLFGFIKFYSRAIANGIKPVCGCDLTIIDDDTRVATPLALLVKNQAGYRNLTHLISELYTARLEHHEAAMLKSSLQGKSEGLIALSGAQFGDIGRALLENEEEKARELLAHWQQLFPDSFYLELQRLGKEDEENYIEAAVHLAAASNTPVVATNDVRFLSAEDFEAHEVRVCINDRRTLDDPRRPRLYTDQQYLRSGAEMAELFSDIPEAIANSWQIAQRCNLSVELGIPHLPNYPAPEGKGLDQYLEDLSREGLQRRLQHQFGDQANDPETTKPYTERLDQEIGIVNEMGFAGYFLIVMEFIQWAKDNGIPVGPGRGSGAGSIVAWALGITDLDPLKYDLLFERFLNPERVSMPDFDVDFCMEGRDRVIAHVAELYGKEAVSQIITFGTMAAKAVVRDVARVQGKPYALADKLSKLIPFEVGMTLHKAMEEEQALSDFVAGDDDAQEIMEMAYKLEGITRNVGKHAGGVVIAPTRLTDFTPLYCEEGGGGLVTQFDKNDVETAGLVKFDFLGLRTLTIIDWAVKMINGRRDADEAAIDINDLPLDDEAVYKLLQRGETTAVFQLESRGMKDLIKRLVPNCFEDIIALVALFRPGPLQSGMVDDFINRKHGRTAVVYDHPELEPVLRNTYGVILYQEQVMQIAQVLGSYTLGGADILRKAMGKKDPEEMARQGATFTSGAAARGIDEKLAQSIFDLMEKFAGYGFNKSHSAAYALVSYQTTWLKAHDPAYFMAAVLSADMQNTDKIVTLIDECRDMDLTIVPPDVNVGEYNFTVNDAGEIVYGLGAIKGLGAGPIEAIIATRAQGPIESLQDLCQRVDAQLLNKRSLETLVKSGALDRLMEGDRHYVRAYFSVTLPDVMRAAEQSNRNQASGVDDLFGEIAASSPQQAVAGNPNLQVRPWGEQHLLAAEKESLGLFLSGHPYNEYRKELKAIVPESIARLRPQRGNRLVAGLLYGVRTMKSKAGDTIAFLTLDDCSGRLEVSLFAKEFEKFRDHLQKDAILVVDCSLSVDDYTGGTRGRGKEVMSLDEARARHARRLVLQLDEASVRQEFCDHLAHALEPYRVSLSQEAALPATGTGNGPDLPAESATGDSSAVGCEVMVQLRRQSDSGCIMFGDQWRVTPREELLQRLKVEYGKHRVRVEYQ